MIDLTAKVPEHITQRKNQVRLVTLTAAFALVFINVYSPFGTSKWFQKISQLEFFFFSSLLILAGVLVVAISRLIMHRYTHTLQRTLNIGQYLLWVAAEIISMALVYTMLEYAVLKSPASFLQTMQEAAINTSLVLLLPYSTLWLYFSYQHKLSILQQLDEPEAPSPLAGTYIAFRDEKAVLRITLKLDDLYYIKGADNYVEIAYSLHNKLAHYHLRTSLKRLQTELTDYPVTRCHRSYMVNMDKIALIRRDPDGIKLVLDSLTPTDLPVSRTYIDDVLQRFGQGH